MNWSSNNKLQFFACCSSVALAAFSNSGVAQDAASFKHIYGFRTYDGFLSTYSIAADASGSLYGAFEIRKGNDCNLKGGHRICQEIFRLVPPTSNGAVWTYETIVIMQSEQPSTITITPNGDLYTYESDGIYRFSKTNSGWSTTIIPRCASAVASDDVRLEAGQDGAVYGIAGNFPFKITNGSCMPLLRSETTLHRTPSHFIAVGKDGTLYGTDHGKNEKDTGEIFKIGPGGLRTVLHTFTGDFTPTGPITIGEYGTVFGVAEAVRAQPSDPVIPPIVWSIGPHGVYRQIFQGNDASCFVIKKFGEDLWITNTQAILRLSPPTSGTAWTAEVAHPFSNPDPSRRDHPFDLTLSQGFIYGFTRAERRRYTIGRAYYYGPITTTPGR